jgi:hypothetical protein
MAMEKQEYKKKLHDHVSMLSSVKSSVRTALFEVDTALSTINNELDVLAASDDVKEEVSESPPKKPRPAEMTLDVTQGHLDTWKDFFNPDDVNMLKTNDYAKGQAEGMKLIRYYDAFRKEGQDSNGKETTENKHNTMRNVLRERLKKTRVFNRGGRYLGVCMLFQHHAKLLLEDPRTPNLTNAVFTHDVPDDYRDLVIEWRRSAVKIDKSV